MMKTKDGNEKLVRMEKVLLMCRLNSLMSLDIGYYVFENYMKVIKAASGRENTPGCICLHHASTLPPVLGDRRRGGFVV